MSKRHREKFLRSFRALELSDIRRMLTSKDPSGNTKDSFYLSGTTPKAHSKPPDLIDRRPNYQRSAWELRRSAGTGGHGNGYLAKDEYLYQLAVNCVLRPIGVPDSRPGFRPSELGKRLQQVFSIGEDQHSTYVGRLSHRANKVEVTLKCQINKLRGMAFEQDERVCCEVGISRSWRCKLKVLSVDGKHQTKSKFSVDRKIEWHETFELDVPDSQTESTNFLYIYIGSRRVHDHTPKIIGFARISTSEVRAVGNEAWYPVWPTRGEKVEELGQLHARLELLSQPEHGEYDLCTTEDLYYFICKLYQHALQHGINTPISPIPKPQLTHLPGPSQSIVCQFCILHRFSKKTVEILELAALLNLASNQSNSCPPSNQLIQRHILDLQSTCALHHEASFSNSSIDSIISDCDGEDFIQEVRDNEQILLFHAAQKFLLKFIADIGDEFSLFPIKNFDSNLLSNRIKVVSSLAGFKIGPNHAKIGQTLRNQLVHKLRTNVSEWCDLHHSDLAGDAEHDDLIVKFSRLSSVLTEVIDYLVPVAGVREYFMTLGVDYYQVCTLALDPKYSKSSQRIMQQLNSYVSRHQKHPTNLQLAAKVSTNLYFCLQRFAKVVKENVSGRYLFRLGIPHYRDWFRAVLPCWLGTMRSETTSRTTRAVSYVTKSPGRLEPATQFVLHSATGVQVLSNLNQMLTEWEQIDLDEVSLLELAVTKITDVACDNLLLYAKLMLNHFQQSQVHKYHHDLHDDLHDQLLVCVNDIGTLRDWLENLSDGARWVHLCTRVENEYGEAEAKRINATLARLTSSTQSDLLAVIIAMVKIVINQMEEKLMKHCQLVTSLEYQTKCVDEMLAYIEQHLATLKQKLTLCIFPQLLCSLWEKTVKMFLKSIHTGRDPVYYRRIKSSLFMVRMYFMEVGADKRINVSSQLLRLLEANSLDSTALALQSLHEEIKAAPPPDELCFGTLAYRAAVVESSRASDCRLLLEVINAERLPAMRFDGKSDCFVRVELAPPAPVLPRFVQSTQVVRDTVNPYFRSTFLIDGISKESSKFSGSCLVLSVLHYQFLVPGQLLGLSYVPLAELERTAAGNNSNVLSSLTVKICQLIQPTLPANTPYKILSSRSDRDEYARKYLHWRQEAAGGTTSFSKPYVKLIKHMTGQRISAQGEYCLKGSAPSPSH